MKKYFVIIGLLLALLLPQYARCEGFAQEDRDRMIRLEVKVEEGQKSLQKQMDELKYVTTKDLKDSLVKQIDDLKVFMLWGFGILFGGMGILMGFVIWDRRTAVEPVVRKSREIEEKGEKVVKVLKEYSKIEPKLAEILKALNL